MILKYFVQFENMIFFSKYKKPNILIFLFIRKFQIFINKLFKNNKKIRSKVRKKKTSKRKKKTKKSNAPKFNLSVNIKILMKSLR